jgi:putative ATPase
MRDEGYGANYAYDHDEPEGFSGQNYWPEGLGPQTLYRPVGRGFERDLRARLDHWAKLRKQRSDPD